jgi:hypothetical protein
MEQESPRFVERLVGVRPTNVPEFIGSTQYLHRAVFFVFCAFPICRDLRVMSRHRVVFAKHWVMTISRHACADELSVTALCGSSINRSIYSAAFAGSRRMIEDFSRG